MNAFDFSMREGDLRVVILGADTHHDIMAVADYDEKVFQFAIITL